MDLKGLFIKEDGPKKEKVAEVAAEQVVEQEATEVEPKFNFNYQAAEKDVQVGEGVVDEDIASSLMSDLEETKKSMAYFDFLKAKKAMDAMPMDEAVKFQATFVSLSTQGLTQEGLLSAIDEHLASLDAELENFQTAIQGRRDHEIGSREDSIERGNCIAESKAEEIKKLTEEIAEIQANNVVLGDEISVESASIQERLLNFEVTVASVKSGIQGHKDQVNKYLSQGEKEETTNG
mgnify:CR=1 FL=1